MFSKSTKYKATLSEDSRDPFEYDVIIIGAGISGLTAAFRLFQLKPNISVKILEAQDRIGGRLLSTELPAANNKIDVWDIGGCWIGNKDIQPFINQLLTELNLQAYPQNFVGKKIVQSGPKYNISSYSSSIPAIGFISLIDTSTLLKYLHNTQKSVFHSATDNKKKLDEYDAITLQTLFQRKTWTQTTSDMSKAAIRATFGSEPDKLSSLYFLTYSNSCGGFIRNVESGNNSSHGYKIVGGAQGICNRILEVIGSEILETEAVVRSIRQVSEEKSDFYLMVDTLTKSYKAKHVIVAVSPHLIPHIHIQPPLSPYKDEFFTSVSPGHMIKIILTYEKAFWKDEGFSGEIVTNGGPSFTEKCQVGPLCVVFDATTNNKSPALMGVIGGDQALQYEQLTKNERKEAVLKSFESFFPSSMVRNFIVYCEKVWRHEPYVGGCPVSIVPPGVGRHLNEYLWKPEHGIHFAGSELAKNWMGLIEGAVESGERVALEILSESYQNYSSNT